MMNIKARNIRLLALTSLLVASTALVMTWPGDAVSSAETATGGAASGAGAIAADDVNVDPLSIFSARSPGGRADGAFLQTKLAYEPNMKSTLGMPISQGIFPQELATDEPAVQPAAFAGPQGMDEPVFVDAAQPDSGIAGFAMPGSFSDGFVAGGLAGGSAGGGFGGGGGGGGGFGGGGILPPAPPIVPVDEIGSEGAVVPEPGTWLMLIAGFFGVGSAMRERARARARKGQRRGARAGGLFAAGLFADGR